jgi:hypothetical protein
MWISQFRREKFPLRRLWGQIFILDFAYISIKFPSDTSLYSLERNICATLRIPVWNISILRKLVNRNLQEKSKKWVFVTPTL